MVVDVAVHGSAGTRLIIDATFGPDAAADRRAFAEMITTATFH